MTDTINNGGPAFPLAPVSHHGNVVVLSESVATGMTLRDYFAAKAMQGLLASRWCEVSREMTPGIGERTLADDAYAMADAMLEARSKESAA